jgi:hypothetical protein
MPATTELESTIEEGSGAVAGLAVAVEKSLKLIP